MQDSSTYYTNDEFAVVKVHGTQTTVVYGSRVYKRNLSQLKKVGSRSKVKKVAKTMLKSRVETLPDLEVSVLGQHEGAADSNNNVSQGQLAYESADENSVLDETVPFDEVLETGIVVDQKSVQRTKRNTKPIERYGKIVSSDQRKLRDSLSTGHSPYA